MAFLHQLDGYLAGVTKQHHRLPVALRLTFEGFHETLRFGHERPRLLLHLNELPVDTADALPVTTLPVPVLP